MDYDVIVVGGGPAGLSAAVWLGRARRSVLVVDAGQPRNAASHAMHGFLTRDGIEPTAFSWIARTELGTYPGVVWIAGEVTRAARHEPSGFTVELADGARHRSRKLLLATGVVDQLPDLPGVDRFYGTSVHHCPYCDGFEHRDRPILVVGPAEKATGLAMMLRRWSADVAFRPDDPDAISKRDVARLREASIGIIRQGIVELEGENGRLRAIRMADGSRRACAAIFFNTGQYQRSKLLTELGVHFACHGGVRTDQHEETHVPGLFVAGDATRDVQFAIVAAAEGAIAAVAMDHELLREDGDL